MDFIAIGIKFQNSIQEDYLLKEIAKLSNNFGYEAVINDPDIDSEVFEGVNLLKNSMKLDVLIYLNCPSHKKIRKSSNGITKDLFDNYLDDKKPQFENFLECIAELTTNSNLYFIFAFEWSYDTRVRYETGHFQDLISMLKKNLGWNLMLYDIGTNTFVSELSIPLIFEIKKAL